MSGRNKRERNPKLSLVRVCFVIGMRTVHQSGVLFQLLCFNPNSHLFHFIRSALIPIMRYRLEQSCLLFILHSLRCLVSPLSTACFSFFKFANLHLPCTEYRMRFISTGRPGAEATTYVPTTVKNTTYRI